VARRGREREGTRFQKGGVGGRRGETLICKSKGGPRAQSDVQSGVGVRGVDSYCNRTRVPGPSPDVQSQET
jgi:hypothetical protein